MSHETLENLSHESRYFPPSAEFTAQANGKAELYACLLYTSDAADE